MLAIGRLPDIEVHWSGLNWPDYDIALTTQENIDKIYPNPDLVVAYKPLLLREFGKVTHKTCIRYNEMFDITKTVKEIEEADPDIIICHHENDKIQYSKLMKNRHFDYIGHCAEKVIYKDHKVEKKVDLMLIGAVRTKSILGDHYPLRIRIARDILPKINPKYRCVVLQHPGGVLYDAPSERNSFEFAQAIGMARICITCSGQPKSKFGKYVEVPMCGTALAADLPNQEQLALGAFVIELKDSMSDQQIIDLLEGYLENKDLLKRNTSIGLKYAKEFTQEKYAERFMEVVSR